MGNNSFSINQVMTIVEASERYNINLETLRSKFKKTVTSEDKINTWISEGLVRQSGKTWLLTETFIENNFSKINQKEVSE